MDQVLDVEVQVAVADDPWAVADAAKPREFEYYGQVKADCWFGFFPGSGGKPIPFDPQQHPTDKRVTMIDIQIIPISEQNVSFDIRQNYTDFSLDWTKITLPSIKALGLDGIRSMNNRFARVTQVDGKREKKDASGNKTGEFYKTFKFLEVYSDQASCKAAYSGNAPAHTEQEATPKDAVEAEMNTALQFAKVIVVNKKRELGIYEDTCKAVTEAIAGMPMINKYFTGQSPEIIDMINEAFK